MLAQPFIVAYVIFGTIGLFGLLYYVGGWGLIAQAILFILELLI